LNRRTSPRIPVTLPSPFDKRLKAYCIAAATAGVSALALNSAARAEIVYTPADGHIAFERWSKIDFNHDGIPDASFYLSSTNYKVTDRGIGVRASVNGGIVGFAGRSYAYASAFRGGAVIGPRDAFLREAVLCRTIINHYDGSSTFFKGPWGNTQGRYLGVKFQISGETHYGWIRLNVGAPRKLEGMITGYAYETIANQPIMAGQTSGNFKMSPETVEAEPIGRADLAPSFAGVPDSSILGLLASGAAGR
jgi:hypothetical protein